VRRQRPAAERVRRDPREFTRLLLAPLAGIRPDQGPPGA
jgi:hypothetical protein